MKRRLFRSGNSLVVSLPKDSTQVLGVHAGSEVSVELNPVEQAIIIRPYGPAQLGIDALFARQVAEFIEQYRPALEALAKSAPWQ
jgi:antitoxin component of MazEF toxin-antitoxin module